MHPFISLSEHVHLPSYILIISFVYTYSIFWILRRAKAQDFPVNHTLDIALAVMVGGFFGARIFHVFYEQPEYYLNHPDEIIKFWKGGFVYYGGAIGAFVFSTVYIWSKKLNFYKWADLYTPIFALGYGVGRLACFFNGCCFGKACDLPWGVQFNSLNDGIIRHPTQLYAFLWALTLFLLIVQIEKKRSSYHSQPQTLFLNWLKPQGQIFFFWLFFHGVGRIFMESFRDDFRGDHHFGLSVSTWISIGILLPSSHFLFHRGRKFIKKINHL